jgi:hypothetical protein
VLGVYDPNGELAGIAAGGCLPDLSGGASTEQNGVTVGAKHAIPVLQRRRFAADDKERIRQGRSDVGTAVGLHCGDNVIGAIPFVVGDAPLVMASGENADLSVVGEDRRRERGALVGGEKKLEIFVVDADIYIFFRFDLNSLSDEIVQFARVALVERTYGDAVAIRREETKTRWPGTAMDRRGFRCESIR